jgi:hypothetical protein
MDAWRRLSKEQPMITGTWNITSITGKEMELIEEMVKYKVKVLGISELKKKGSGEMKLHKDFVLRYAGVDKRNRAKHSHTLML